MVVVCVVVVGDDVVLMVVGVVVVGDNVVVGLVVVRTSGCHSQSG